jgi:hypothetical protein
MRIAAGYGFGRLADEHGFAVVYPNGYEGYETSRADGVRVERALWRNDSNVEVELAERTGRDLGLLRATAAMSQPSTPSLEYSRLCLFRCAHAAGPTPVIMDVWSQDEEPENPRTAR